MIASVDADDAAGSIAPGDDVTLTLGRRRAVPAARPVGGRRGDDDRRRRGPGVARRRRGRRPPATPREPPPERRFGRRALIIGGGRRRHGRGGRRRARRDRQRRQQRVRRRRHRTPAASAPVTRRCGSSTGRPTSIPPRTAPPARSTGSRTPPGSTSPTARTSTTTTRSTTGSWPPVLSQGQTVAYDIICPTNWMAARLKGLGWLDPLPIDRIPNRVNLEERFLTASWDYGASYNLPWQAGITGHRLQPGAHRARADAASTTCSTRSSRARWRCSPRCATRSG